MGCITVTSTDTPSILQTCIRTITPYLLARTHLIRQFRPGISDSEFSLMHIPASPDVRNIARSSDSRASRDLMIQSSNDDRYVRREASSYKRSMYALCTRIYLVIFGGSSTNFKIASSTVSQQWRNWMSLLPSKLPYCHGSAIGTPGTIIDHHEQSLCSRFYITGNWAISLGACV